MKTSLGARVIVGYLVLSTMATAANKPSIRVGEAISGAAVVVDGGPIPPLWFVGAFLICGALGLGLLGALVAAVIVWFAKLRDRPN